jgi:EAL domain-containing protein (putative c-di-GMP-specific phosphodiesterase class I)
MTTSCIKCDTLPVIPNGSGDIIISCEVSELAAKMQTVLSSLGVCTKTEDETTLWASVSSFSETVIALVTSELLNRMELESITLLYLAIGESLTPSKLRQAKTLQKYKDLLGALDLATLLNKGGLTTHFQPIVDLATSAIYGYESLVRGVADNGSLIFPDKLFKWARESDMLFYLDRACRESALKTAAVKNIAAKVFINFIPTAIYDPEHCLESTVKWAKQLEFDPKNIIFEVVESDHISDIDHLKKILDFYKSQGFKVALDDVGSGYSSLNMIGKLRPDIIKIDREIIDKIDENQTNQSIFKAIVTIAKENNIMVLAEGVERVEEVAFAQSCGADLAQGYYFGRASVEPVRKLS